MMYKDGDKTVVNNFALSWTSPLKPPRIEQGVLQYLYVLQHEKQYLIN